MAGGGGGGGGGGDESSAARELDQTPTWAVALVCAVIVVISILLEKLLHGVGEWFRKRRKEPMLEALEKIKGELMVLGFISLLLTFGQIYIANICIPTKLADTMLPCPIKHHGGHHHEPEHQPAPKEEPDHHRRLLWNDHRILAGGEPAKGCKKGYVPLISIHGLHQLHIFIFFLAVFHVIYSAITMTLGRLKIRGWKEWERETETNDEFNDPTRFRLTHETSFVKEHTSFWVKSPFFFYFVCFFRQLFKSVNRADYLTMRHGFISVHLAPGTKFDFQKYIKRSLEDDFKVVVGISPVLWASAVIFLLLNVNGWQSIFWLALLPLIVILSVGTKLQAIITQMAVEIVERHAVVQGIPLVQVSDRHFWFGWPQLILHLIHITLFQNALELTYFFWIWYEFGLKSCFHQDFSLIIMRVALGVGVQFLCSYITLPLYALVTQMGSTMKRSIFDDQTSKALRNWHKNALKKKSEGQPGPVATQTLGGGPGSPGDSPEHSPTLGRPSYAPPPNTNTSSANIIASVDIRAENAPSDHKGVELGNRDLLTGGT
ncbi:MLO-like protein 5 [Camellia lanceoleosa]|uniref:MLO-like protein 5 n=1 Tax=Camellia lanceoleosa TaxID=1840588 RepID=A0ACC0H0E0_9ERIC|nr:MLO-like protein 5 [Camellia lanceoleosa]